MKSVRRYGAATLAFGACAAVFVLCILLGASSQSRESALFERVDGLLDRAGGQKEVHRRELSSEGSPQGLPGHLNGYTTDQVKPWERECCVTLRALKQIWH